MDLKELFELVGMAGLLAAMILFTVFSKGREARVRRKILKSISEEDKKKPEDTIKPVFFETIGGKELPVQLGFYSPGRIVMLPLAFWHGSLLHLSVWVPVTGPCSSSWIIVTISSGCVWHFRFLWQDSWCLDELRFMIHL